MLFVIAPNFLQNSIVRAEKKKIILKQAEIVEGGENAKGSFRRLSGSVELSDGSITLRCNRATEYEASRSIVLEGKVMIANQRAEVYADGGTYYPDKEIGDLNGKVRLRTLDGALVAIANTAHLNHAANQITLYGNVVAWHEAQQVSGNEMVITLRASSGKQEHQVEKVDIRGNAFLAAKDTLSKPMAVYNQFSARRMTMHFNEASPLQNALLQGQSESLWHLYSEENQPSAIHYSSGNTMQLAFREGALYTMKVSGHCEGKHYPASFWGNKKINLPFFVWREKEYPFPKKK